MAREGPEFQRAAPSCSSRSARGNLTTWFPRLTSGAPPPWCSSATARSARGKRRARWRTRNGRRWRRRGRLAPDLGRRWTTRQHNPAWPGPL